MPACGSWVALLFSATGAHAEESTKIRPLLVAAHDYRIARAARKAHAVLSPVTYGRRHRPTAESIKSRSRLHPGMGAMPGDPKECRQRALNCVLLAKEAATEQSKQMFLSLAQSWTSLAAELEDTEALLKTLSEIDLKNAGELTASE
jgi:hypothetical protein